MVAALWAQGLECTVEGIGFRVPGIRLSVCGLGYRVERIGLYGKFEACPQ